jgi:RimJ/RimL family protein N-acetyltransferase
MADGADPVVNLTGERVALGPLRRDLLPLYRRWMNDLDTQRPAGFPAPAPQTDEWVAAWYERAGVGEERVWFTVYELATGRPIGYANLRDVDFRHRTAEFGLTVGERECRGRGYGTEATRLVLDHAFTALGLHNVLLTFCEYNPAGRLWDEISMDCLATDVAGFAPDE